MIVTQQIIAMNIAKLSHLLQLHFGTMKIIVHINQEMIHVSIKMQSQGLHFLTYQEIKNLMKLLVPYISILIWFYAAKYMREDGFLLKNMYFWIFYGALDDFNNCNLNRSLDKISMEKKNFFLLCKFNMDLLTMIIIQKLINFQTLFLFKCSYHILW